jgi:hypothetical protein
MKQVYLVLDKEGEEGYAIYGCYSSLRRAWKALDEITKCGCKTGVMVKVPLNQKPEINNIEVINK